MQHTPHVYADNGDYTVTINGLRRQRRALTPQTITIHVNNVAPTLTLTSNSYSVDEGS